jgi:hypothetical protein
MKKASARGMNHGAGGDISGSVGNLQMTGWDPAEVMAHPWYKDYNSKCHFFIPSSVGWLTCPLSWMITSEFSNWFNFPFKIISHYLTKCSCPGVY